MSITVKVMRRIYNVRFQRGHRSSERLSWRAAVVIHVLYKAQRSKLVRDGIRPENWIRASGATRRS